MQNRWPLCLIASSWLLLGCAEPPDSGVAAEQMVYYDTKTQQAVVFDTAAQLPARHPVTHQPTLMPALYCEACELWRPVPPADQINRIPGAAICVKCQTHLIIEGPWPETRLASEGAAK